MSSEITDDVQLSEAQATPVRMAGRPKREAKVEESKKEAVEKTAEQLEIEKLKAELEAIKESNKPKPQIKLNLKPEAPHICCEIISKYNNLEASRQAKFYELQDKNGGVMLQCPLSGLSTYYKNLDQFPRYNTKVPCDQVNSMYVKYTIISE